MCSSFQRTSEDQCKVNARLTRKLCSSYVDPDLLVNAPNAFKSLNREAAVWNTRIICPILAPMLINTYWSPARCSLEGGTVHILSQVARDDIQQLVGSLQICAGQEAVSEGEY